MDTRAYIKWLYEQDSIDLKNLEINTESSLIVIKKIILEVESMDLFGETDSRSIELLQYNFFDSFSRYLLKINRKLFFYIEEELNIPLIAWIDQEGIYYKIFKNLAENKINKILLNKNLNESLPINKITNKKTKI